MVAVGLTAAAAVTEVAALIVVEMATEALALLLEAALFAHLTALVVGLDEASGSTMLVQTAVEKHVLAQLALQRTVVKGCLQRRLQSDLVEALLAVAQDPRLAACQFTLQLLPDSLVQAQQVGRRDALAIRRIRDDEEVRASLVACRRRGDAPGLVGSSIHDRGGQRKLRLTEVGLLDGDVLSQARSLHVASRDAHSLRVVVATIDVMGELALAGVVVVDALEEFAVEVGPLLEGIALTEHARSDAASDQRCLDTQRAAAAEGVQQVALAVPTRHHDDGSGQDLVERSCYRLLPVATAVQTLAAAVQGQRSVVVRDVDVELDVGVRHAHVGAPPCALAQLIDNGVLHLVRHKLRVAELGREDHAVHGERTVDVQVRRPVDGLHGLVDIVGRAGLESLNGFEDADGRTQAEVGAVHHLQVAREGDHAATNLDVTGAQFGQLLCQQGFKALEGLGDEFGCH